MVLQLYMYEGSIPARSVLITAAALGLEIEKKIVDMANGEHRKPEFLKMNPQHTVPVLVDDDYVLWESHAITPYLVEKYGKDDLLYPKNVQKRGTVNQRLHLDNSTILPLLKRVVTTAYANKSKEVPRELLEEVFDFYQLLETLLERTKYIADDRETVADFSILMSLKAFELFVPVDQNKYPKLFDWVERMKGLPCCQTDVPGFAAFEAMVNGNLQA